MIIQFPNGSAVHSSIIASIYVEPSRKHRDLEQLATIVVHTFRDGLGLGLFGSKPTAAHFMSIPMPSENEANNECRRLVAKWMGLPEPAPIPPLTVDCKHAT